MRITNEMMVTSSLRRLSTRLERYERAQAQLATGKRIQAPSDDPAGMNRALGLRGSRRAREQELRNAGDALSWLDLTDSQLQAATRRLQRVRELTVRGADGALGTDARAAVHKEVLAIRDELVAIGNTRHRGRALFGGFSDGDPVVPAAAPPPGYELSPAAVGAITRRVGPADEVVVNVTADAAFGPATAGGPDLFALLDEVAAALDADDTATLSGLLDDLDAARDKLLDQLALVGANTNWVESAQQRAQESLLTIRSELAEVEDTEITSAVMELQTQEVAYQATLQALARALPPSLVSFLR